MFKKGESGGLGEKVSPTKKKGKSHKKNQKKLEIEEGFLRSGTRKKDEKLWRKQEERWRVGAAKHP